MIPVSMAFYARAATIPIRLLTASLLHCYFDPAYVRMDGCIMQHDQSRAIVRPRSAWCSKVHVHTLCMNCYCGTSDLVLNCTACKYRIDMQLPRIPSMYSYPCVPCRAFGITCGAYAGGWSSLKRRIVPSSSIRLLIVRSVGRAAAQPNARRWYSCNRVRISESWECHSVRTEG